MKTVKATEKPPFNEWIKHIHEQIKITKYGERAKTKRITERVSEN